MRLKRMSVLLKNEAYIPLAFLIIFGLILSGFLGAGQTAKPKKALFVWGGWEGHEPKQ